VGVEVVSNVLTSIPIAVEIGASFLEMEEGMYKHRVRNYLIKLYFCSGK
jgi:hypothetical protein